MDHNISELVKLLDKKNYEKYNDWKELGLILYNIDNTSLNTTLSDDFYEFTDMLHNKENKDCSIFWQNAKEDIQKSYVTCLIELVKRDNYEGYIKYLANQIYLNYDLEGTLNYSSNEELRISVTSKINNIIYDIYGGIIFAYMDKGWYKFASHKWEICVFDQDILPEICRTITDVFNVIEKCYDVSEKYCAYYINFQINNIDKKKYSRGFAFTEIFDTNTNLLGFNNGVYDMIDKYFRIGYPSDYISRTVNYDYVEFGEDDIKLKELNDFLKLVGDDEEIEQFNNYAYSCLTGNNGSIYVWHGKSGRYILSTMLSNLLGQYVYSLNGPLNSKKYFSQISNSISGCRLIISEDQESENIQKNSSEIKNLIKGNNFDYLYDAMVNFRIKYKKNHPDLHTNDPYYCDLYKNDIYGKLFFCIETREKNNYNSKKRKFVLNRSLYEEPRITFICCNFLIITNDLFVKTQSTNNFNEIKFESIRVYDSNDYERIEKSLNDLKQIFMWKLLSTNR